MRGERSGSPRAGALATYPAGPSNLEIYSPQPPRVNVPLETHSFAD